MNLASEIAKEAKREFSWTNADGYSDDDLSDTMDSLERTISAKLKPVRDALVALLSVTDVNDGNYKQYAAAEEALAMLGES